MNITAMPRRKVLTPAQVQEARDICRHHKNKPCNGWVLTPIYSIGKFGKKKQIILQFRPVGFVQTELEVINDGW